MTNCGHIPSRDRLGRDKDFAHHFRLWCRIPKPLILMSVFALFPTVALAQSTSKVDCSAYHKNDDDLWTVKRSNVIIVDGKPISIDMTMGCCFGSDSSRLIIGGVNIIRIVEKSCF
jgi:hypothetical protein